MATSRKRTWRLTDRGKVVLLVLITVAGLLLVHAADRASSASAASAASAASPFAYSTSSNAGALSAAQRPCTDPLVTTLRRAGFTGRDLQEAWAIAMRESAGQADLVSHAVDYGLFQFNIDVHGDKYWWDTQKLLTADYNARVAYLTSHGGEDWLMWGLAGSGSTDARMYPMWTDEQIERWITEPVQRYFEEFEKLPQGCRR